jgi:putrescine importer
MLSVAVIIWLLTHLDSKALILGTVWVIIGFAWLLYLTKGLRNPAPEMALAESEQTS